MRCIRILSVVVLAALLFHIPDAAVAQGQPELPIAIDAPVPGVDAYDDAIPTPEEVIGHEIGTRHTAPYEVVQYFEAVAAASDRVTLERHGTTYGDRPLIHAFVTSPDNHNRLDDIRAANRQLSEAPEEVTDAMLQDHPAVAYMGYSIHGDEASGTESAVLLLYHLAAGSGPEVDAALSDIVTIIDPLFNPDGRNRFVNWVNNNRGGTPNADPQDREHDQPWPGGRTNHYWFDLNRDWLPVQHPESQGRIDIFQSWRPQVLTDFHEMGSEATYFFQPGVPDRTNPNTPQRNQDLTGEIATYHADYLDEIGSLYYTRETFDDYYYGKGSTYPDINGAIGILFEQASSRSLKQETSKGVLTYAFSVRNQFMTSLSTLKAITEMRTDLLAHQRDFFANVDDELEEVPTEAYIVDLSTKRTRAQAMAQVLQRHDVDMYALDRQVQADGRTYRPGEAYVIPLDQRQGRFINAAMEQVTSFPDSIFYDVSTWSLPLAFGVDYTAYEDDADDLLGAPIADAAFDGGQLVGGRSDYAYVMEWGRYFAPRALYRLQDADIRPRIMMDPFTLEVGNTTHAFDRGAIVIPVTQRGVPADTVHAVVRRAVDHDHVNVYAANTGLTPTGPDLGSRGSEVLPQPTIALITGTGGGSRYGGSSAYNSGEVWHLLSERFDIPVSLVDLGDVQFADLSRYNTMVLAGGSFDDLPADKIRNWVQEGGRLIALEDAVEWPVDTEMVSLEEKDANLDSLFQDTPYGQLSDAYGAQQIGGSIFQAELDLTHPLAFGYDAASVPVFRVGNDFYAPSGQPGASVATYSETQPRLSGYVSEEMADLARGSASIEAHGVGSGSVILMMDNPNFRAFWWGTNGLFLNAVFFGSVF